MNDNNDEKQNLPTISIVERVNREGEGRDGERGEKEGEEIQTEVFK